MTRCTVLFSCLLVEVMCLIVFSFENVALNKSAWQQDTVFNYAAKRGVDGRKSSLSRFGDECVTSEYNATSEWRVDLEHVLSIHHISILFATDDKDWNKDNELTKYFLGFSAYISNTTEREDGILCFRDTTYTRATIPNPINIPCPHYGRFVTYYNNRTHIPYPEGYSDTTASFLCEVEVYGCSDQGKFGENCSMPCPPKCLKNSCDITKGTCFECIVGYLGPTCEIKEKKPQYPLPFLCGAVGFLVIVVSITSYRCCIKGTRGNAQFSPEDEIIPQNLSTQVHSEDLFFKRKHL
uniref:Uncharacterized protein LOC111101677 isoform X2 n=1 Tax=Crassostrea virginica TaxID=6565 RepID=A0A8B8AHE8_CRAVI|nr:uncharacterized protein LOC111101677 isoform X2 [Crassostrea virginica]